MVREIAAAADRKMAFPGKGGTASFDTQPSAAEFRCAEELQAKIEVCSLTRAQGGVENMICP